MANSDFFFLNRRAWRKIVFYFCMIIIVFSFGFIILQQAQLIFPHSEWKESTPEQQGVNSLKLLAAVQFLQTHSGSDGIQELVIIRNGYLIWKGDSIDKVHGVWSMTKSFTSSVLGILIDDEKVSIDTRASEFVPGLMKTYPDITFRHFNTMTSGYTAVGDNPEYSHGQSSTPYTPSEQPLFIPPGSKFAYWDSAENEFAYALTQIADEPIGELFRKRIAEKIGMKNQKWSWKAFNQGNLVIDGGAGNRGGIYISAREMARYGLLFLNRGKWCKKQLLSTSWVDSATSVQVPASLPFGHPQTDVNGGPGVYGYGWWINCAEDSLQKWPDAPPGTYASSGYNNNDMFIIPEWGMVIVRLGLDQKEILITDAIYNAFLKKVGEAVN